MSRLKSSSKEGSDLSLIETKISTSDLKIHMYVDVSVIEIFLNYERIITSRIYPNSDSKSFELYSVNKDIEAEVKLWTMSSCKIWNKKTSNMFCIIL